MLSPIQRPTNVDFGLYAPRVTSSGFTPSPWPAYRFASSRGYPQSIDPPPIAVIGEPINPPSTEAIGPPSALRFGIRSEEVGSAQQVVSRGHRRLMRVLIVRLNETQHRSRWGI
jgi:hypothetical protein